MNLNLIKPLDLTTNLQLTMAKEHIQQHHRDMINKIQIVGNPKTGNPSLFNNNKQPNEQNCKEQKQRHGGETYNLLLTCKCIYLTISEKAG